MSRTGYVNYHVYRAERKSWFDILARRLGLPMPQAHAEFVRLMDIALQYTLLHSGAEHSLPSRTGVPPVFAARTVSREENQNQEKEKGENKHG
ncbi:MAG: hypothetical protein Q7U34_01455 [Anaerolineales bacterium]|nr:hypothetical protein [Anaerolineales bacterium]